MTHTNNRPLKIGLILPQWSGGLDGATPRWADILAIARRAEALGYDSLWTTDDLLVRFDDGATMGVWECWSVLGALAAATSRVEIGTLVISNNFRNPALLAKMADTLDEVSGGRIILGIGAGGFEGEHRDFGFQWENRYSRLEEALAIIRGLYQRQPLTFEGKHYQLSNSELLPPGPRPAGPPVMTGFTSPGPRMLSMTARYADLVNIFLAFGDSAPDKIPPMRDALDDACRAVGRDPATLGRTAAIGVALGEARLAYGQWDVTSGALSGSAQQMADAYRAFAKEGISHLQIFLAPYTLAGVEEFAQVIQILDRD